MPQSKNYTDQSNKFPTAKSKVNESDTGRGQRLSKHQSIKMPSKSPGKGFTERHISTAVKLENNENNIEKEKEHSKDQKLPNLITKKAPGKTKLTPEKADHPSMRSDNNSSLRNCDHQGISKLCQWVQRN